MKRRRSVVVVAGLVLAAIVVPSLSLAGADAPGLGARVAAMRAVEEVRWSHRTWPAANPGPKPALDEVVPAGLFRERVLDALAMSLALERYWNRPLQPAQLQAELDRMARETQAPDRLRELFAAVGNDAVLAAEVIARPVLAERLLRGWYAGEPPEDAIGQDGETLPFDAWWAGKRPALVAEIEADPGLVHVSGPGDGLRLPIVNDGGCQEGSWSPIDSAVPDPEEMATAVWTGTEMIVWGGNSDHDSQAGWRYDPATDTWRFLPLDGAPSPRYWHTAVWTGTEMIVWGGKGGPGWGEKGDGARYDPLADRWTPVTMEGAPGARYRHTAVWTGTEMIVWGGLEEGVGSSRSGGRYDPVTDTWRETSRENTPGPRSDHVAAWTGSEMIVWGGGPGSSPYLYDPVRDAWRSGTSDGAPKTRKYAVGAWTGTCLAVWGGSYPFGDGDHFYGDGGCYDPVADRWERIADEGAPTPRRYHAAAWTGDRLVVWGGEDPGGHALGDGAAWIAEENRWAPISSEGAPSPRRHHVMVWTGEEVIAWGGKDRYGQAVNSGGRYDPDTGTWVPVRSTPEGPGPRASFPGVWTGEEFVVWGGRNQDELLGDGAAWDPATASWRVLPVGPYTPSARHEHAGIWTGREVLYWGGWSGVLARQEDLRGDGARWDPVAWTWKPMAVRGAPSPRVDFTAVWSGTEMIVWGGDNLDGSLDDGGRYDPRTDSWRPMARNPAWPLGIKVHAAAWADRWMIVWGGRYWDPQGFTDRWIEQGGRYDPEEDRWEPMTTEGQPTLRAHPGATWTGEEVIFWGGWGRTEATSDVLNTGGRYDPYGDSWEPMTTDGAPRKREFHAQAWSGKFLLVWGGYDGAVPLRSGGSYDPVEDRWEPLPTAGAPRGTERLGWAWTGSRLVAWGGRPATSSGGAYCAPCGEFPWYRDADGDGHGDPADRVDACEAPAGYVAFGDDCDDADPLRYPGRPEACNGIDDDCDGTVDGDVLPPPGWVRLSVAHEGTEGARLSWDPLAGADAYDADRGDLGVLLATGSLFDSVGGCLADDTVETSVSDAEPVAAGEGRWYLVRGVNCGGPGTFNVGGPGQGRDRDGQLLEAPGGCP